MNGLELVLTAPPIVLFGWFARADMRAHKSLRPVSRAENALHAGLGLAQLVLIGGALIGALTWVAGAALATAVLGAGDEYVYHRAVPAAEADLHAKAHLALFILLAVSLGVPLILRHARG